MDRIRPHPDRTQTNPALPARPLPSQRLPTDPTQRPYLSHTYLLSVCSRREMLKRLS